MKIDLILFKVGQYLLIMFGCYVFVLGLVEAINRLFDLQKEIINKKLEIKKAKENLKKMTAKDIFRSIGYKLIERNKLKSVYEKELGKGDYSTKRIEILLYDSMFGKQGEICICEEHWGEDTHRCEHTRNVIWIDSSEFQAISKQLGELMRSK